MKISVFDIDEQNSNIESRIVVALERVSEAFRVLLWNEGKDSALSPIQIQILVFIQFHTPDKCKVGYLADEFNMTKATISDSVKALHAKGLVAKETDPSDTRSFSLALTTEGKKIVKKASLFAAPLETPIANLTQSQKVVMLDGLLRLIHDLHTSGIITIQRMCFTCANYQLDTRGHYCHLLKSRLAETELRIDCPEHVMQS